MSIHNEEGLHRSMSDSLVPIDKGMIADQGVAQGGCLGRNIGIEILPGKTLARLDQGGLQGTEISSPVSTTSTVNHGPVEFEDFS